MRCLIVEDDLRQAVELSEACEALGWSVDATQSVADAVHRLLVTRYDVIIVDLFLPDGSGARVADVASVRHPGSRVIVFTGTSEFPRGEAFQRCPNISKVLRKGSDRQTLLCYLEHIARGARGRAARRGGPGASPGALRATHP